MTNNQPIWDFSVYDTAVPRHSPDTSTPARKAAVSFENSIRRDPAETGAFFRQDGTLIVRKTGLPNRVGFSTSELATAAGSLFTHNHPEGYSFSVPDIQLAVSQRLAEIRAVAPYCRHAMRPKGAWPSVPDLVAAIQTETQRANAHVHSMEHSGQLSSRFVDFELQHQIWVFVSRSLNLEYRREAS